jgi:hypothetical protein
MRIIHANDESLIRLAIDIPGIYFTIESIEDNVKACEKAAHMYYRVGFIDKDLHQGDIENPSNYTAYKPLFTLLNPRLPKPGYVYRVPIDNYFKVCFIEVVNRETGDIYYITAPNEALTPFDSLNKVEVISVEMTNEQECDVRAAFYETINSSMKQFTEELRVKKDKKWEKRMSLPFKTTQNGMLWINEVHWMIIDKKIIHPQLSDPPISMKFKINNGISCFIGAIQKSLHVAQVRHVDLSYGEQNVKISLCSNLSKQRMDDRYIQIVGHVLKCSLVFALVKHSMNGGWNKSNFFRLVRDPCLRFLYEIFFMGDSHIHDTLDSILDLKHSNYISDPNTYLYIRTGSTNNPITDSGLYLPYFDVLSGPYVQIHEYKLKTKQEHPILRLWMSNFLNIWERGYLGGREFKYKKTASEIDLLNFSVENACLHLFLSINKIILIHDSIPSYALVIENWFQREDFKEWVNEFHTLFKVDFI